ncbi:MAG TPA: uracil-DNA glycosylase [Edaphobacter sp.]|nr:uracil-DNA glycosylase [Edaphobacter sp.]
MAEEAEQQLRAYVEYFRDLGVYDLYRRGEPVFEEAEPESQVSVPVVAHVTQQPIVSPAQTLASDFPPTRPVSPPLEPIPATPLSLRASSEPEIPKLISFNDLAPVPEVRLTPADKPAALEAVRQDIGDCTRCPLAYAGRHKIVFADGDPNARLMFVGEGPGADEDAQGLPFVGKAGQLLNNMIGAMGLKREQVYIANIVKCRPPANRVPEPVEANTCSQFLLRQIDIVQPQIIVALGATAATYLLGAKQSLAGLRGRWHSCRGAKLVVTYHPAFLLRDPRQKGEAWKDLQMVMKEMGLKAPAKT